MQRLTLKEWYAAICDLHKKYPDWDRYDEKTKRRLANRHGYPYHIAANSPRGIFTKTFRGSAESVDRQNIHWQNEMLRQYKTFHVVNSVDTPVFVGLFAMEYKITVTYRI